MEETGLIAAQLKALVDEYGFSYRTLSDYTGLSERELLELKEGNAGCLTDALPVRFQIFNKISFLYYSAKDDKDFKLSAFLEVLLSFHGISKETVARMAGVTVREVEGLLASPTEEVPCESKYRIAVTVMALRFFFKDCEPKQ